MKQYLSRALLEARKILNRNGSLYCPVCQSSVNHFLPLPSSVMSTYKVHGWAERLRLFETLNYKHYYCPVCYASDRERLYANYLSSIFAKTRNSDPIICIDFAPSKQFSYYMKKYSFLSYHMVDRYIDMVNEKVDIENLPYKNSSIDFFICSHVLEHVNNDFQAMSELCRILKPDGFGIIMVPILLSQTQIDEDSSLFNTYDRWHRFGQGDHIRLYSKDGFIDRLQSSGFAVEQLGVEKFTMDTFTNIGVDPKSVLYIVQKRPI